MDQSLYDQTTNLLDKSQKILILAHARVDCDGLGAALSAYLILSEMGKDVTVATNDPAPENLQFLPSMDIVKNSLAGSQDLIINVDTTRIPLGHIKYNVKDDKVSIIITPKEGAFSESDVSFERMVANYDLILVLDTGNLEHLGPIYERNVEMFFKTPVINIDHHSSNTDFGQVNLVDVTAASTTEVLFEYFVYLETKLKKKLITEDIATLLLAGIITDTGSFQHANTSPRSMETASKLLDLGARQQEIIKNIYKTKKLSTLKLWGIILSKVQVDPVHRMVWSSISYNDIQEASAHPEETEGIIDDLLTNAPGAEIIFLIKQNPDYVSVSMRSTTNAADVGKFCADNEGGGHVRAAGFKVYDKKPFEQIVSDVIGKVKQFQAERLNIHEDEKPMVDPVDPVESGLGQITNQTGISDTKVAQQSPDSAEPAEPDKEPKTGRVTYLDFASSAKTPTAPAPTKPATDAPFSSGGSGKKRKRQRSKKKPVDQTPTEALKKTPPQEKPDKSAPYVEPV